MADPRPKESYQNAERIHFFRSISEINQAIRRKKNEE